VSRALQRLQASARAPPRSAPDSKVALMTAANSVGLRQLFRLPRRTGLRRRRRHRTKGGPPRRRKDRCRGWPRRPHRSWTRERPRRATGRSAGPARRTTGRPQRRGTRRACIQPGRTRPRRSRCSPPSPGRYPCSGSGRQRAPRRRRWRWRGGSRGSSTRHAGRGSAAAAGAASTSRQPQAGTWSRRGSMLLPLPGHPIGTAHRRSRTGRGRCAERGRSHTTLAG